MLWENFSKTKENLESSKATIFIYNDFKILIYYVLEKCQLTLIMAKNETCSLYGKAEKCWTKTDVLLITILFTILYFNGAFGQRFELGVLYQYELVWILSEFRVVHHLEYFTVTYWFDYCRKRAGRFCLTMMWWNAFCSLYIH